MQTVSLLHQILETVFTALIPRFPFLSLGSAVVQCSTGPHIFFKVRCRAKCQLISERNFGLLMYPKKVNQTFLRVFVMASKSG